MELVFQSDPSSRMHIYSMNWGGAVFLRWTHRLTVVALIWRATSCGVPARALARVTFHGLRAHQSGVLSVTATCYMLGAISGFLFLIFMYAFSDFKCYYFWFLPGFPYVFGQKRIWRKKLCEKRVFFLSLEARIYLEWRHIFFSTRGQLWLSKKKKKQDFFIRRDAQIYFSKGTYLFPQERPFFVVPLGKEKYIFFCFCGGTILVHVKAHICRRMRLLEKEKNEFFFLLEA